MKEWFSTAAVNGTVVSLTNYCYKDTTQNFSPILNQFTSALLAVLKHVTKLCPLDNSHENFFHESSYY